MANMIARLGVLLGLDSAEFRKGIAAASKDLDKFVAATKVYGAVAATAFTAASVKAMQFADELSDVAKANDTTIASILSLQNALQMSGGKAENAGKMFASFTQFIDTAAQGSFEAQKAFAKAGIGLSDLAKLDAQALFGKTVAGLAEIPDTLTRNAKAFDIFGRAAKGVDFVGLNDELKQNAQITKDQAAGIQAAADAWDKFDAASRRSMTTIASALGPSLLRLANFLDDAGEKLKALVDWWQKLNLAASASITLKFAFGDKAEAVKELARLQNQMLAGGSGLRSSDDPRRLDRPRADGGIARLIKPGVDKEAEALRKRIIDSMTAGVQGLIDEEEKLDALLRGIDQTRDEAGKAQEERLRVAGLTVDRAHEFFMLELKTSDLLKEDAALERELLEIRNTKTDRYRALVLDTTLSAEDRLNAMREEDALMERSIELARARNAAIKQTRQGTFEKGFLDAAGRFFRDLPTEMENGAKAFESVMSNMETALANFVRTGKLNFKDLTRSIIQDLILIQMRSQMTGLFRMALSAFSPAAAGFTGVGATPYADGGNPEVGKVALVGERGPELFVPRTAGTIIPNGSLSSALGQTHQTVYNGPYIANMSAIDTQSGIQFLAKNKQTVWAVSQSAQRSLPVSR